MDMERNDFHQFGNDLTTVLRSDDRVIGLIALGSMAATDQTPEEWSDHDFWIVAKNGAADEIRNERSWLPRSQEVAIHFTESAHGRGAIYHDGHLVEYAVFDDSDLEVARANAYSVLIDNSDIEERMQQIVARTTSSSDALANGNDQFGSFASQLTTGINRFARGERLSANHLIRGWAARSLVSLLHIYVEADRVRELDNLDPNRRFELVYPILARQIEDALANPTLECAGHLLDIAARELTGRVPAATPEAFAAVRSTLDRANRFTESALSGDTRS